MRKMIFVILIGIMFLFVKPVFSTEFVDRKVSLFKVNRYLKNRGFGEIPIDVAKNIDVQELDLKNFTVSCDNETFEERVILLTYLNKKRTVAAIVSFYSHNKKVCFYACIKNNKLSTKFYVDGEEERKFEEKNKEEKEKTREEKFFPQDYTLKRLSPESLFSFLYKKTDPLVARGLFM